MSYTSYWRTIFDQTSYKMGSVTVQDFNSATGRLCETAPPLSNEEKLKGATNLSGLIKESPYHHENVNWNHYHQYRPRYPHSLWKLLEAYHDGPLHTIHDTGAGGGAGSASLLQSLPGRICHLIMSDPSPGNLYAAGNLLTQITEDLGMYLDLRPGMAEKPLLAPGELVDLTMVCMALHWMDPPVFLDRVAESSRPGATFMAVQYNPYPVIVNNPNANLRLRDFVNAGYSKVSKEALRDDAWALAARLMSKGIRMADVIDDDDRFEHVVKIEINTVDGPWWFPPFLEKALPGGLPVSEPDVLVRSSVQKVEDHTGWGRQGVDLDWIRGFLSTLRGSSRAGFSTDVLKQDVWEALAAEVDGPLDICWQGFIVLARRKEN